MVGGAFKRFQQVKGMWIEKIYGQERFGFSKSDMEDICNLPNWEEQGGYQGTELLFYDFETGEVYKPFDKKRNVTYGTPLYAEGFIYFLQGDCDEKQVSLYRCIPSEILEKIAEFSMKKLDLHNLAIVGQPIYVISQERGEAVRCYYPESFIVQLGEQESVMFIRDGKLYIDQWVEEGWDEETDCATDQYRCYHRTKIKDFAGKTLSEEIGCLNQSADGTWWLA